MLYRATRYPMSLPIHTDEFRAPRRGDSFPTATAVFHLSRTQSYEVAIAGTSYEGLSRNARSKSSSAKLGLPFFQSLLDSDVTSGLLLSFALHRTVQPISFWKREISVGHSRASFQSMETFQALQGPPSQTSKVGRIQIR